MTFILLYLGNLPDEITGSDRYLLKIFIAAAKKAIQTDPPMNDNWLEIIREIHEMERLTFLLRLENKLYNKRWEKWIKCIERYDDGSYPLFASHSLRRKLTSHGQGSI